MALAALCVTMAFTACSDSDDPVTDDTTSEMITQPVEDVVETYFDGDIAVMGSSFDEMTERLLARVKGQTFQVEAGTTSLPSTVKALFIDQPTWDKMDEDYMVQLYEFYQDGVTICMHKPTDLTALAVILYLRWKEMGSDDGSDSDENSVRQAISSNAQTRATTDNAQSYDFIAIKKGGKSFHLCDVYDPSDTYDITENITSITEEGDTVVSDTIISYPAVEPTPYQYGLFAEEAVEWLNETEAEARTRATRATGDGSYDDMQTVVVSTSSSVYDKYYTGFFAQNEHSSTRSFSAPLTINVYSSMMYNFDKDEDYYSIVVEEQYDASKIYDGIYFKHSSGFSDCPAYAIGLTRLDMQIRTSWGESDYAPRMQYDIQPLGTASSTLSTEIDGWQLSADVSIGMEGVTGKPMAKISSEKRVTEVQNDVTLTNQRDNALTGWTSWKYDFGHQPSVKHKWGKGYVTNEPPTNATCRSFSVQSQAWKWLVPNTKQRGDTPFTFKLNIASFQRRKAWAYDAGNHHEGNGDAQMDLEKKDFTFDLPVPQRYKHVYSLTTDEIGDLAEFNNLMTALRNVSTNFNTLYNKLIRLDSDGNSLGRTGVTEKALTHMVGQEWYALASEVQGKKIAVSKTYKFYVKDETGAKLSMLKQTKEKRRLKIFGRWTKLKYTATVYNDMGTYLIIGPDGITIE